MDVKDLRTESALSELNNDGSKYSQGGIATLQCNRNKSYQDIGSTPLGKAEGVPVRPCAVIGPDRVIPPPAASDAFLKKAAVDPWPSLENGYRRPPDYPHRLHQNPARNISPRQTFQENMQRINVPPTYNTIRHSDSANFSNIQDRSVAISKNAKPNMAPEAKYCDVPYTLNALPNEPKNVRDHEIYVSGANPQLARSGPHAWPPGNVNVNTPRTYSATEPYQYPQYTNCGTQRPPVIPMTRPHRTMQEDPTYVYPDHYYREAIGRLKPYPPMKERFPQPRYEYVGNYPGQFHPPPPVQPLKYDIPKSVHTHPYPVYPPLKYLDNRIQDPALDGYHRSASHQHQYNIPYRTQVIHPTYTQVPGNTPQKVQPYLSDGSIKSIPSNKLHYDNSSKLYIDYENSRTKPYPMADNYYVNDLNRFHPLKNQMVMPNYSPLGMRAVPSQQYYLKDNTQMKSFEYMPTFRNFDPHLTGNPVLRHAPQFSPNTLAISPTDSTTSNDTSQTHGTSQEDCGYVSQSSTTSVRSIDSGIYRLPHEYYKRHEFRYGPVVGSSHTSNKADLNSKDNKQKQINVRQFLQMWNEGEDENNTENNNSKEIIGHPGSSETTILTKQPNSTEDQLYVLGLVNVSSEDLDKYEHIEKISKLPENIKGYNNLELFSRFEEAMESCNTTPFKTMSKEFQNMKENSTKLVGEPRPVSPLDVEAKISQSVIHKEVGCNFEIKPCSPKMLNVEVAAPAQNILSERVIEKVSNPLSKIVKSPLSNKPDENAICHTVRRQDNVFAMNENSSCKMIQSPYSTNNMDSVKTSYTLHDLEINSGICLASLPRLDNEIELNFAEVNQQFINANKKDGFSAAISSHPSTPQDNANLADNKEDNTDSEKYTTTQTDCEKTCNKLSKFRKSKTNSIDKSEYNCKIIRTDSVIIKNPENIENKMLENGLNIPMNLSSQSQWCNSPHEPIVNKDDIALDFSLSKSNDLPVIENEKDETLEQSHITSENIMSSETPYQESEFTNHFSLNPNVTDEPIKSCDKNDSCLKIHQDVSCENDSPNEKNVYTLDKIVNADVGHTVQIDTRHDALANDKLDLIAKDVIKSPVVNSERDIANTQIENKTDIDLHTDGDLLMIDKPGENKISEKLEDSEVKYNSSENVLIVGMSVDNTTPDMEIDLENYKQSTLPCTKNPCSKSVDNTAQLFDPPGYGNNCIINSQTENDFVHDEISASLEKLFQEGTDKTSLPNNEHVSKTSNFNSLLKNCHQSKELYSPWIQKLMIHREGSCNKTTQKNIKSIFDPDEPIEKFTHPEIGILKSELQHDSNLNHNEILSLEQSQSVLNKFISESTLMDLTSDSCHKLKYNVANEASSLVTTSKRNITALSENKNESYDTTHIQNKKHDVVNNKKIRKERALKKTRKLHSRRPIDVKNTKIKKDKLAKEIGKQVCKQDNECSVDALEHNQTNGEDTLSIKKTVKLVHSNMSSDAEFLIDKDLTVDNSTNTTEEKALKTDLTENTMLSQTFDTDTESGILNCRITDCQSVATHNNNLGIPDDNITFSESSNNSILIDYETCTNIENEVETYGDNNEDSNKSLVDCNSSENNYLKTQNACADNLPIIFPSNITAQYEESQVVENVIIEDSVVDNVEVKSRDIIYIDGDETMSNDNPESEESKKMEHVIDIKNSVGVSDVSNSNSMNVDDLKSLSEMSTMNDVALLEAREHQTEEIMIAERNTCDAASEKLAETESNNIMYDKEDLDHAMNNNPESCSLSSGSLIQCKIEENKNNAHLYCIAKSVDKYDKKQTSINSDSRQAIKDATMVAGCSHNNQYEILNNNTIVVTESDTNLRETKITDVINDIQEKVQNNVSEMASNYCLENSKECKIPEQIRIENITKSVNDHDDEKCFAEKPLDANIRIKNTCHESQHNDDILPEKNNDCTTHNTYEPKDQENFTSISDNEKHKLFQGDSEIIKSDLIADDAMNLSEDSCSSNLNFECKSFDGNHAPIEIDSVIKKAEAETEEEEKSELSDSKHSNDPDSLPRDHALSIKLSDQWIEDCNEQTTTLSDENIPATANDIIEYVSCEDSKDISCNLVVENDLLELETELSDIPNIEATFPDPPETKRLSLKRSFSDSALNNLKKRDSPDRQLVDNTPMWPPKRRKIYNFEDSEQQTIEDNFCNFIQNRRNSISSYYNAENVSFCILIDDDCIITEETESDKICFAEVSEDCITEVSPAEVEDEISEIICCPGDNEMDYTDTVMMNYSDGKSIQESWLDDVACVETVVSDDTVENTENDETEFIRDVEISNYDESGIFNSDMREITDEVNFVNEETVCEDNLEPDNSYISPICSDNKILLYDNEPQETVSYEELDSGQCLENILLKSYNTRISPFHTSDYTESIPDDTDPNLPEDKENMFEKNTVVAFEVDSECNNTTNENNLNDDIIKNDSCCIQSDNTKPVPQSSLDDVFCDKKDEASDASSSSSPEVSSTTFEEKSSSILLKITNYNGSRVSEINEVSHNKPRCKFTESKDYSNSQGIFPKRPLITKGAQKYIPPLKESIRDLKVKLPLPQQKLLKLKQLKLSKNEPKIVKQNVLTIPKKPKPKPNFEDVLKNIDEVQIKMHKENTKKNKNVVPKVVIKKNVNGSHYTSSASKQKFNPDLTGRKWQPWVFLERNHFIDNMVKRNQTKAIFSHRKNIYVLAENFKKYKSVNNCTPKFVISQPKTSDSSKGELKYTIRLKHS